MISRSRFGKCRYENVGKRTAIWRRGRFNFENENRNRQSKVRACTTIVKNVGLGVYNHFSFVGWREISAKLTNRRLSVRIDGPFITFT